MMGLPPRPSTCVGDDNAYPLSTGGLTVALSLRRRVLLIVFACLQNALLGGLIYGWASIDRGLMAADPTRGGAGLSPSDSTRVFGWASSVGMFSTLLLGILMDRYGPRTCSLLAHVCIAAGCLLVASSPRFECLSVALCLIAFGGPGIQISIVHVANLFPRHKFMALSLLNGTVSISFMVLLAFDALWEQYPKWMTVRHLFGGFTVLVLSSFVASALCWPDKPFNAGHGDDDADAEEASTSSLADGAGAYRMLLLPTVDEGLDSFTCPAASAPSNDNLRQVWVGQPLNSYLRQDYHNPKDLERRESYLASRQALKSGHPEMVSLKDLPFWKQLTSGTYLRALVTFGVSCFLANFYVGSVTTEMADGHHFDPHVQHHLAQVFTVIMSFGITGSFVIGYLMDRVGLEICTILTLGLGQVQCFILLVSPGSTLMMMVSFVSYTLFRQWLFPTFIGTLTTRLGFKYFGILNGLGFAAAGLAQIFMAELVQIVQGTCHWILLQQNTAANPQFFMDDTTTTDDKYNCDSGKWHALHTIEFMLLLILMLLPVLESRENRRRQRMIRQILDEEDNDSIRRFSLLSGYGSIISLASISEHDV